MNYRFWLSLVVTFIVIFSSTASEATKKLLVVTTTLGFRHSSIPTAEKILAQLAQQTGKFTVEFVQQPPGKPSEPKKPAPLKADATAEEQTGFKVAQTKYESDMQLYQTAKADSENKLKDELTKLSPIALQHYDGVIFLSTTGDLPIPAPQGFLDWIKAGHAFIGIHSASDTLKNWREYGEMLGGVFDLHKDQVGVECLNQDAKHPANKHLGATWKIEQEEIYRFRNYDPALVHELLVLDKDPNDGTSGHFPISWCQHYGKGKVFYTALGHREDLWDDDANLKDRKNSVEITKAFQQHILGGIEWAVGLNLTELRQVP